MLIDDELTKEEFYTLIDSVGWLKPSERLLEKTLKNSISIKYVYDDQTVAMARAIYDGGYCAFIMDVVVLEKYRNIGIGTMMINRLIERLLNDLDENEKMIIELLAAPGKTSFYERLGFKVKKEVVENGMYKILRKEGKDDKEK